MADSSVSDRLIHRLAGELGFATAASLVERLVQSGTPPAATLVLLQELEEVSPKAARAAIEALPELDRRAGFSHVSPWLDLGVALAESSGATALKYFKDSPLILGVIERVDSQLAALMVGLELAEHDANVTMEFLKAAPQILTLIHPKQLKPWLDIGVELTRIDLVVGLEYIRQIPALAPVLPVSEVRSWSSFGMKLTVSNAFGKPDYLATIEFLRTSPAILGDIEQIALRSTVISLGALLAEQAPEAGIAWLAESPRLLRALPSPEWQEKVLQYGSLLAEKDAQSALSYLRRGSEIVVLIGDGPQAFSRFDDWFKAGMEVLAYSAEGARAYFAMESQKALSSVERALSGVPLRQVARKVKLFIQGLCGSEISIMALPESVAVPTVRATVSADGKTIALPALLRRFPTADQNERLYLVMAAHEAGHLQYGTYRLKLSSLTDLWGSVRLRYGQPEKTMPDSLAGLFRLYPHPRLVHDLWTILEDARVEYLLQMEYPGLRRDLAQLAAHAITPRDPAHGLTVKELIIDCLLRLSTGETESTIPQAVKEEVSILWKLCEPILSTSATAESAVRLAHEVYVRMEELLAPRASMIPVEPPKEDSQEVGVGPTGSEQGTDQYRPVTNWVYRGEMNPEFITRNHVDEQQSESERMASQDGGSKERSGGERRGHRGEQEAAVADVLAGGRSLPPAVEEVLALDLEPQPAVEAVDQIERVVRYPEWDHMIQDYRMNWCRVVERGADAGSDEFVSGVLTSRQSVIRSLRRFFESLRPPAFRRIAGQTDGEDLDIDAVVRWAGERQAGVEGDDRIYIRREKKERDVAVAFLVDVSGSTGRQIESGRRVIDVEKEGLVMLCEALEAVGDQYALYAYSGQGRNSVDMLTIKHFDERLGVTTAQRLGGLAPRQQNRDGAAIRHAVAKLRARDVKTRILILLSDGRPLDGDYKDEYALEDTKAALWEARREGIDPFCVTIDREADSYLRRMYGDVHYLVIDRIESLPVKLPWIYQQLAT